MKTLEPQIAIIGSGQWGINHVKTWSKLGYLRLICEINPERQKVIQTQFPDIEVCSDRYELFKRSDITAVVIATPAATHVEITLEALRAGKDVLVEKPMALSVTQGKELVDTARELDRILMVGHVLEYHPAVSKLKELVKKGELGRIQYIYSNRLNLGRIRTEENALWSFAPHDIAIILQLLETMPNEIHCHGGAYLNHRVADVTLTSFSFPSGICAHIHVSWLHPFKEHLFVVVGDRQMAVFDDTLPWTQKLVLYPHRVHWMDGQIPVASKAEAIPLTLEEDEPLKRECEHFVDCVIHRKQPLTNGESGLRVLRVLESAQKALEKKSEVLPMDQTKDHTSNFSAHPTATIDPEADIGKGTKIWHYSHVMKGSRIGQNCILGQNVFVGPKASIGNGVKIQNNVSLYEGVVLEDYVFCGPSMVFTNVINPRSEIERKNEFRKTLVGRGATLGANCTIICGVTIGRYALIGAGAVVTKDVPDYAMVIGVPARIRGWVCKCGEKLTFEIKESTTCLACGSSYHLNNNECISLLSP